MAIDKKTQPNIDNSNLSAYPNGQIRDNDGSDNGTAVNRTVYSDIHEFFARLMRKAHITYGNTPDNELNGFQLVDALQNIATKNDKIQSVTTLDGVINVTIKLGTLEENEFFIGKVNFNLAAQTQIKGSEANPILNISFDPSDKPFKTGEYLRFFYNGASIVATRLADASNLDVLTSEKNYLKAATEAEEYAASTQLKATTPYTNALAFARRVIGLDSFMFLATISRNGLYPKEHFTIVNNLSASAVKNTGWFSGLDVGGPDSSLSHGGDIASANSFHQSSGSSLVVVDLENEMDNLNYFVRIHPQSQSSDTEQDNGVNNGVFKVISKTQVQISFAQFRSQVQNLKVYIEVVQS